ncbi:MAG: maleylpyruvate isomerase family mycothiol-dependent enzyme [Pseudonocardia sediminis]
MDAVVTGLAEQHADLEGLLVPLGPEYWSRPSPDCPGWTVADLVLHLAQADEWAMAGPTEGNAAAAARMAGGPPSPGETTDDTVGRMVAHERGGPAETVLTRWRESSRALREFLLARDPREPLPWIYGDLPARTLATTRLVECWIHTRDVANALGATAHDGDQLWHVARLAWRTLPFVATQAGRPAIAPESVHLDLTPPGGGDRWTFGPADAPTSISGTALDFCLVAARRVDPSATALVAHGPDAEAALSLVRTWA